MIKILTPKESNVYSKNPNVPQFMTPKESNVYSKNPNVPQFMTPKESNVYSKMICRSPYDSYGVEHEYKRHKSYKHTIPLGLTFKVL